MLLFFILKKPLTRQVFYVIIGAAPSGLTLLDSEYSLSRSARISDFYFTLVLRRSQHTFTFLLHISTLAQATPASIFLLAIASPFLFLVFSKNRLFVFSSFLSEV